MELRAEDPFTATRIHYMELKVHHPVQSHVFLTSRRIHYMELKGAHERPCLQGRLRGNPLHGVERSQPLLVAP